MAFVHLHNHTQYSMLDGACRVDRMLKKAKELNMSAVAMTDHGNMYGVMDFYTQAQKLNKNAGSQKVKPIIGIETYIINGDLGAESAKREKMHHLVLLAKNKTGYHNLVKLSSRAFIEGFYYKPRIDKALLRQYAEGLICLSGCLQGELATLLLKDEEEKALEALSFYKEIFPQNFYIEIQDHGLEDEKKVAPRLIRIAEKTDTPLVVTNDCHYLAKEDAEAHDALLCIQTGKNLSDENRMKYETDQLYFKSEEEMRALFPNLPEAYDNTVKIADEIDLTLTYDKPLFPKIPIPDGFEDNSSYLRHLCYESAKQKYTEVNKEVKEQIDHELKIIHKMGFDDYFLTVKDFIDAARDMNVPVGPGRGSVVGSIVSYLLGITKIDPLKYNLYFERFLNPHRISMPDIDIDFCAEGRAKIIDYVKQKYGERSVAQIITFGRLKAKSVIKDVARVLGIPPATANELTKMMPSLQTVNKYFPKAKQVTVSNALKSSKEFADKMQENKVYKQMISYAKVLEGLIRHAGVHAAGVVIGPGDLMNYIPLAISKQKGAENAVLVQFEGMWLDELKMLKMDFLGLKTLTLIKRVLQMVEESKGIEIDIDYIDLSDEKAYKLLSEGRTDGVFQLESAGMKKNLMELQPNKIEDVIAMVALYRPGPMQYIDKYIRRKHGKEKIEYLHPLMEKSLKESYGVIVYQEQVMSLARELAGMSSAEADSLRKAIGKKNPEAMEKLQKQFYEGAKQNGVSEKIIKKIWEDLLEFASYAFNKSHAAAYAFVAFQTAYLKAHYPVEFMAASLSLENDPSKIPSLIAECKNMGIEVIPPNINLSECEFTVKENKIMFGLKAIKNVGSAAINSIISERKENGKYLSIFDLTSRIDSVAVNKGVLESLVSAGALDELEGNRAQKYNAIEDAINHASIVKQEKEQGQMSLFEMLSEQEQEEHLEPKLPEIDEWTIEKKLQEEKKILGFYRSGHPLERYKLMIETFSNATSQDFVAIENEPRKLVKIAGIVAQVIEKIDRNKKPYATIFLEDLYGKFEVALFQKNFEEYFDMMKNGEKLFVIGRKNNYSNGNDNLLRIDPVKIYYLDELPKCVSGTLMASLSLDKLNSNVAKQLLDLKNECPGKFSLLISVVSKNFSEMKLQPRAINLFPDDKVLSFFQNKFDCKPTIHLNVD